MRAKTQMLNEQIRLLMNDFTGQAVNLYGQLGTQPVCHAASQEVLRRVASQPIPADGRPLQVVYSEMLQDIYSNISFAQHPRSFSCVPSTMSLLSWMGDVMTSAYNPHASCQMNAPAADLVEKKLIRWMCDQAGYPESGGGLFVSGGSIANLTALTAARDAKLSAEDRSRAIVYVSDQTHSSVAKGLHIIGFTSEQIHLIPTDRAFCMDSSLLRSSIIHDIALGKKPFAVVASAGTTNTGSVDPLPEIAALCREYDLWMHVDGAFGASALLSEHYRDKLAGIECSDSMSWDAHKWMMQTYGCSVVLVRDQSSLARSFAAHPEYLKDAEASAESIEFWDLGPELTRPARSLKLWLSLQVLGSKEFGEVIEHGCAMAELAEGLLRNAAGWEIISPAQLGILTFRYVANGSLSGSELDHINQDLARKITESGFAQIFTTQLRGKKVLRMCTINPETTAQDICETIGHLKAFATVHVDWNALGQLQASHKRR